MKNCVEFLKYFYYLLPLYKDGWELLIPACGAYSENIYL